MNKREKILLIDFSKVVSPIWISRHLSACLSDFVKLPKDEIRNIYKQHIWPLVKWEYSISVFLEEIIPYLKSGFSKDDLVKACTQIPTLDIDFLQWIKILKHTHYTYLVSDIHEVLWEEVRKELKQYFDGFIFSFEEKAKKSEDIFWQNLQKKIDFSKVELFVDDKEKNINLAWKYWIKWLVYDESLWVESLISKVYSHRDYCILWAWAAWIIFSYNLLKKTDKSFCILEKQSYPFWLMKSFKLSNSWCDLWWHALHDRDKKVIEYIHKEWEIESYRQKREAYVDYENKYIPFPFQLHLSYLESKKRNTCILDFLKSYCKSKLLNNKPKDLESFLEISFWKSISNSFLKPYNEKLWKTDLNGISCNWSDRIPFENIRKILKWAFKKDNENYWSNSYVNYPESWWFENYLSKFFSKIKKYVNFSCHITNIDTKYHIIYTDTQVFHYGNLISTIPLNQLLKLSKIEYEKDLFKYLSLQIFSVIIKKMEDSKQRIYVKDKEYYFHKCVFNSNSSQSQKNQNEFVIQFESTFKEGNLIEKSNFEKNCINYLIKKWLLKNSNDIITNDYREVEYWYPMQTLDLLEKKDYYIEQLKEKQIFVLWRFGEWKYYNLWDIIHSANILFKFLENEYFVF